MKERSLRFQHKLWQIVNSCQSGVVKWSDSGNSIIFKFAQFKKEYLDKDFCKSNKIASFVRQLNLYGFRKLVKPSKSSKKRLQDYHEFQNEFFQRNRRDLLEKVIRSSTTPAIQKKSSRWRKSGNKKVKRGRRSRRNKPVKQIIDAADHYYSGVEKRGRFDEFKYFPHALASIEINPFGQKVSISVKTEQSKYVLPVPKNNTAADNIPQRKTEKEASNLTLQRPESKLEQNAENFDTKFALGEEEERKYASIYDDFQLNAEDEDENDDFYAELMKGDDDDCKHLDGPALFREDQLSKLDARSPLLGYQDGMDFGPSEELLELMFTKARMDEAAVSPMHCACDTRINPRWMTPNYYFV